MDKYEVASNWREKAEINWKTARKLLKMNDYYSCLFFCHLAIEKLLKGLIIQNTQSLPPYEHDLVKLAYKAKLDFDDETKYQLETITGFMFWQGMKIRKTNFTKDVIENIH